MNEHQGSYRQIFKATSLFGGVQVFNILINIVRVKFVAVLLGTVGMGIMGLLNAPLQLLISITGLGIAFSAVRDVSEASGTGDQGRIAVAIKTLRRWSWFTGLLGAIVTVSLAPLLSQWTFGNHDYTWAFVWLSVTLLLQAISRGQSAILQGTRRLMDMAKASVYGTLVGLFTAVPLFYFYGVKGIVPSIIVTALVGLLISWYFSRKVVIEPIQMTFRESLTNGKSMVKLGLVMTFAGLIGNLTSYILSAYISRQGGIDQVGLYNSGWSIVGQYTGLVFIAMSTDYFPRMAAINHDNAKLRNLINQQAEMVILILCPLLILLVVGMPIIIRLLYTPAFLPIVTFANWTVLGILLKGMVWPIGFVFPAKGDLKIFGVIEVSTMVISLITNISGFYLWGLEGLGISFIINYLFGLTLTLYFANKKFGFRYEPATIRIFSYSSLFLISAFLSAYFLGNPTTYFLGLLIFMASLMYSLVSMNRRIDIIKIIHLFISRFRGK